MLIILVWSHKLLNFFIRYFRIMWTLSDLPHPLPQSSYRVRNNLFMQGRNETIQSVQFYSVLSFSIQALFYPNPFALSSMTAQSQIESCLEFDKKSALKFVTLHFEVHFLYLFSKFERKKVWLFWWFKLFFQ